MDSFARAVGVRHNAGKTGPRRPLVGRTQDHECDSIHKIRIAELVVRAASRCELAPHQDGVKTSLFSSEPVSHARFGNQKPWLSGFIFNLAAQLLSINSQVVQFVRVLRAPDFY